MGLDNSKFGAAVAPLEMRSSHSPVPEREHQAVAVPTSTIDIGMRASTTATTSDQHSPPLKLVRRASKVGHGGRVTR